MTTKSPAAINKILLPKRAHMIVYHPKTGQPMIEGRKTDTERVFHGKHDVSAEVCEILRHIDALRLLKMLPKERQIELIGSEITGKPTPEQVLKIRGVDKIEVFLLLPEDRKFEVLGVAQPDMK